MCFFEFEIMELGCRLWGRQRNAVTALEKMHIRLNCYVALSRRGENGAL